MDGSHFDHLARTLVTRMDRRRVLGGALMSVLGASRVDSLARTIASTGSRQTLLPVRRHA
jgi:hypothetical protein